MKSIISVLLLLLMLFNPIVFKESDNNIRLLSNDEFGVRVAQCIKVSNQMFTKSHMKQFRLIGKSKVNLQDFNLKCSKIIQSYDGRFFIMFDSESSMIKCMNQLENDNRLDFVEKDEEIAVDSEIEQDDEDSLSWGCSALQTDRLIKELENKNIDTSVTVAIVDSGAADIEFIRNKLLPGYDFVDNDTDTTNDIHFQSHGTFLSSIVVDNTRKLPIYIMPVRVVSSRSASISNVVNGIYYAVDHGADVINISLGGTVQDCESIDNAVEYANNNNVSVVVCAGNERKNTEDYCPAHIESAVTISAVNTDITFAEKYSNYGASVDFTAPGTDIKGYDANGNIEILSGTSMSAAFFSSCMAIVKMLYPGKTNMELLTYLENNSVNPNNVKWDQYYGFGIPQMYDFAKYENNGINISQTNVEMNLYGKIKLIITDKVTNDEVVNVRWKSSDENIVSVNESGEITAVGLGNAKVICITDDGKNKISCFIKVVKKAKVVDLDIFKLPDKINYIYKRENFEPKGIVVVVTYDDDSKKIIDDSELIFNGFNSSNYGKQKIIVSYEDISTSFNVWINYEWWQWIIKILLFGWIWY